MTIYTYITCVLYKIINFFFALADIFHHYNVMCKACTPCTCLLTYLHSFHIYFSAIIKKINFFAWHSRCFFFCDCLLTSFLLLPYVVYTCMGWYEHIFIIITTQYCDSTVSIQASRQAAKLMGIPFFLSSYILSFLQSSVSSFSHITSLPFSQFSSVPFIIHTWPIIRTLALSFPICLYFIYIFI